MLAITSQTNTTVLPNNFKKMIQAMRVYRYTAHVMGSRQYSGAVGPGPTEHSQLRPLQPA